MQAHNYFLIGEITENAVSELIIKIFQDVTEKNSAVTIYLSSTGGDMDAAYRLHDFLKTLPVSVTTIGFGQIDSAAIAIFCAGTTRKAVIDCRFFFHEGTFTVSNPSASLQVHRENAMIFENLLNRAVSIIAETTGKPNEDIRMLLQDAKIMTVQQASAFDLVHETLEKLDF